MPHWLGQTSSFFLARLAEELASISATGLKTNHLVGPRGLRHVSPDNPHAGFRQRDAN